MTSADGRTDFVAALPTPPRVGTRFTVAAVLLGTTLGVVLFDRHPLTALTLVALGAAAVWREQRWPLVAAGAVLLHSLTVGVVALASTTAAVGAPDGAWWTAMPIAPGTVVLLGTLTTGLVGRRTSRTGPALAVLLLSLGTLAASTGAVPAAAVGLDVGTLLAAIAVADRTAQEALRRPGDPGPVARAALVALALLPAAVVSTLPVGATTPRLVVLVAALWCAIAGVGLAVASRRETRLRRTADDLAALTSLFVDSEDRGVMSVDPDGIVLAANEAAESMLGAPDTSIVGHNVDEFVPASRRVGHARNRATFSEGRGARPMSAAGPVRATSLAGTPVVVRIALRRVTGERDRMMAVIENLTARRAEEEELRTRLERQEALLGQLRRLEALRTGILTATSHELRTPVTVLHATAELLSTRMDDLDADTRDLLLERQLAQCRRLVGLLDDLVTIDPDGEITTHPRVIAVNRTVAAITERWSRRNEEFPVTVLGHGVNAWADPATLERIITTLLDNARTYGAAPVAIQVMPNDGGAKVAVSDSGDGIPPDLLEEIFQPFGRGAALDEANPGLGLGLPLARILAEADGGTLQAIPVTRGAQLQLTLARPPEGAAAAAVGLDGRFSTVGKPLARS